MTSSNRALLGSLLAGAFALACGAETGNGVAIVTMKLTAEDDTLDTVDAQGTAFNLERAQVNVRHIELLAPGDKLCNDADYEDTGFVVHCDSAKIRIEGPIVVDLITGETTPSLDAVKVPAATYQRVDVRIDDAKSADGLVEGNDRLLDHTLDASGTFQYQGASTDFDFRLNVNEDVRFEAPGGVTITEDGAKEVLLLLDVATWFTALPITRCLDDGDLTVANGRLELEDQGRCSNLQNSLKDAIKRSARLDKK